MGTVCGEGNLEGRSPWGSSSCVQREHRAIQSYKHMQRNHFIRKGHFDPRVFIGLQNPPTVLSWPTRAEDDIYPQGSKVFIKPKKYVSHVSPRNGDVWQVLGKNVFCCRPNIFKHFLGRFFFILDFYWEWEEKGLLGFSAADLWLEDIKKSWFIQTWWWCGMNIQENHPTAGRHVWFCSKYSVFCPD